MNAELIKVENGYALLVNDQPYASTSDLLSLRNCQRIAIGYDLEELAQAETERRPTNHEESFKRGFELCRRIYLGEIESSIDHEWASDEIVSSFHLDRLKWDVLVEMEDRIAMDGHTVIGLEPKLDADGCLILKRI
jgi:hypothetical protein